MMYKSFLVAFLATTALARPQHAHKHHHFPGTGTAPRPTGTGAPFDTGNSTGIFANGTGTGFRHHHHTASTSTSTVASVVTMTVMPLPLSSGTAAVAPENKAAASGNSACGGSQSTVTVTSTEMVTVTLEESSTASQASAAATPSSSSSSSGVQTAAAVASTASAAGFYAPSSVGVSVSVPVASSSSVAASYTASGSSSAASATASSSSGSSSGSKRGLAYNEVSLTDLFSGKPVSWAYNWAASPGGTVASGLEYVPMAWCPTSISQSDWNSAADAAIASGSKHLLSWNEPDQSGQCSISAAEAASTHTQYMQPYVGKASIGSPAVTNGGPPMGLSYLSDFLQSCGSGCPVDFLNIHYYNGMYDGVVEDFQNHVNSAIQLAQQNGISKVWVTEFALNGASDSDTASFLDQVLPWLDSQSAVERYAFFMCSEGILTSGDSISSQIGAAYISAN